MRFAYADETFFYFCSEYYIREHVIVLKFSHYILHFALFFVIP